MVATRKLLCSSSNSMAWLVSVTLLYLYQGIASWYYNLDSAGAVVFLPVHVMPETTISKIHQQKLFSQGDLASVTHSFVSNTLHREKTLHCTARFLSLCWCSLKLREGRKLPPSRYLACQRTSLTVSHILVPHSVSYKIRAHVCSVERIR